jgi:hypothetical protein
MILALNICDTACNVKIATALHMETLHMGICVS